MRVYFVRNPELHANDVPIRYLKEGAESIYKFYELLQPSRQMASGMRLFTRVSSELCASPTYLSTFHHPKGR